MDRITIKPVHLEPGDKIVKVGRFDHTHHGVTVTETKLGALGYVVVFGTTRRQTTPGLVFRGLDPDVEVTVDRVVEAVAS